uniref:PQQ-binding-like beta-propeller repeat protein n=1 Tax=Thaumasiovibrio occultus TaxID=1891184 RepID=UPI000B35D625|nr:PQQ-binding-like beta-propeller repeat protein [Thaumasiovibrio occultus]
MTKLIVVGGRDRKPKPKPGEGPQHDAGVIISVDVESGEIEPCVLDNTIPQFLHDKTQVGTVYKAATITPDIAYICSTTEIIEYDPETWQPRCRITHPLFNDLHHVLPSHDGHLYVANTGLDRVLKIDNNGELLEVLATGEESLQRTIDADVDYRQIASTKPHFVHPNFVFYVGETLYCTRFNQKDAIAVSGDGGRFNIEEGNVHDGVVHNGKVYFTCTNGRVVCFDLATQQKLLSIDLNQLIQENRPLGWCRSVAVIDDERLAVGFSRLRPTKFKENIDWVTNRLGIDKGVIPKPSRLSIVNMRTLEVEKDICLESADMHAIFSVHRFR